MDRVTDRPGWCLKQLTCVSFQNLHGMQVMKREFRKMSNNIFLYSNTNSHHGLHHAHDSEGHSDIMAALGGTVVWPYLLCRLKIILE